MARLEGEKESGVRLPTTSFRTPTRGRVDYAGRVGTVRTVLTNAVQVPGTGVVVYHLTLFVSKG